MRGESFKNMLIESAELLKNDWIKKIETQREKCLEYLIVYGVSKVSVTYYIIGVFRLLEKIMREWKSEYYERVVDIVLKCENVKHGKIDINELFIEDDGKEINLLSSLIQYRAGDDAINFLLSKGAEINEKMFERAMERVKRTCTLRELVIYRNHIRNLLSQQNDLTEDMKHPG